MTMQDQFGRHIDYLRISITDRCNLRCRYCMPQDLPFIPHEEILRYEEIVRLCAIAAQLGVRTLKVTGGEPLVRKGCTDLMRALKALPGIEHVTLTTNGVLLEEHLSALAELGVDGINISLDTLDRETYRRITGQDALPRVLDGLYEAVRLGLRVKLNCVPLAESGLAGLLALAELAARYPVDVRFIELMPIGHGQDLAPLEQGRVERAVLEAWPDLVSTKERRGYGPARYYLSPAFQGAVGFIDAVSHSFCEDCNRVRLTSEGYLKLCLCYGDGLDLRALLRGGASDADLKAAMSAAILGKPARHSFGERRAGETRNMSQIGG
jgi:cyclic pyranopterin phosphate synthase